MNLVESRTTTTIIYIILAIAAFTALFPIALMVLNSLKTTPEIASSPLALPLTPHWDNYTHAWQGAKFSKTFINSAVLMSMTIFLVLSTGSLTAYVLARKKIKAWKVITAYLLATTTAPIQLFLFPLYFGFAKLGLINNVFAVSVVYCALFSPFSIMLLRTYFLAVPKELEEAALVDGATPWQVFSKVYLPMVWPGLLTVALIVGLYTWNEFLIATTFLQASESRTAVVSYFLLSGQYSTDWGDLMAGAMLVTAPIVILFIFLQRHFIEGMTGGSVKG
ncbi:MAG: carbohydrate ABC transporter permease [Alphaproteobacteria bacterium]|nr:carbohydrate ABC transporter permease [Alphaproteobacteria bacterium]